MKKFSFLFILLLTLFSLFLRLYRIEEPQYYYFDEVYHAVTAKAYADNNPDAYNPFSPPPREGTAYDWLHPPLAKLIQAGSIKIFGDEPFGWRLPSVIFGTAIIPATFILSFILFGPIVAIFASVVIAFENLTFVLSRITMNDVFLTFFVLGAFIFTSLYLKTFKLKHLVFTGLLLGLAVGSKWTGAYAVLIIFIAIFGAQLINKKLSFNLLLIIFIPMILYLMSYGQFWLLGNSWQNFVDLHKQIWWYQNRHDLQHTYGTTPLYCVQQGLEGPKTWCPWVLNARGVYFSYEEYGPNLAGYIYALGNPFIFWSGIIAASYLIGKYIDEKNKKILLILAGYFVFWVPWIFSPRIMFLYHYLPAIPFLAVGLGVTLNDIFKTRLKYLSVFLILLFIAAFIYFYPISSGWPIPIKDIDAKFCFSPDKCIGRYMWLPTWR